MVKKIMKYLKLEDIKAYRDSSVLSDLVWETVIRWDWFTKQTTGMQLVRAVDSIAANIAEGFGRFHKKDKQKFYYNARGSVYESGHWINKAYKRHTITEDEFEKIIGELRKLPKEINLLIKITEEKLNL